MLTGEIRSQVDRVWDAFWTGGISNPLTVIEQISYLLFIKRLDDLHTAREKRANLTGQPIKDPVFSPEQNNLRWSRFKQLNAEEMFNVLSKEVFPFIKNLHANEESSYAKHMKDAIFMIQTPALLERVIEMISKISMDDRDTKGDLYEYLLSKLSTAGVNGQFRTPRHLIKMIVELMKPSPTERVCDPACGTAGFLVSTGEYLRDYRPEIMTKPELTEHFNSKLFNGFDFDATMIRIGVMNMMLHGVENPGIILQDSLSELNSEMSEEFSMVLANPPFKGSLDEKSVSKDLLKIVNTKKTELLFLALILKLLKNGGRAAVIVPDGVLFGSSNAHIAIRKTIIEDQKLEAVISLPSGVFKPYAGVSTGILIFTKTSSGGTDKVWFYDMIADGFSLDDKRTPLGEKISDEPLRFSTTHEQNNIPDVINRWDNKNEEENRARTEQSFFVTKEEIVSNKYDLSINRYKEVVHEESSYESPKAILEKVMSLEKEIVEGLVELGANLS